MQWNLIILKVWIKIVFTYFFLKKKIYSFFSSMIKPVIKYNNSLLNKDKTLNENKGKYGV